MYQVLGLPTDHLPAGDPNRTHDPGVIRWWLDRSDYGPRSKISEIVRFSSFEHLSPTKERSHGDTFWTGIRARTTPDKSQRTDNNQQYCSNARNAQDTRCQIP